VCILCVFVSYCIDLYNCKHGGVDLMGLKPNPYDLSSFIALTLLVGSFDPQNPVPDMTYNVSGGTLNLAVSIYPATRALSRHHSTQEARASSQRS